MQTDRDAERKIGTQPTERQAHDAQWNTEKWSHRWTEGHKLKDPPTNRETNNMSAESQTNGQTTWGVYHRRVAEGRERGEEMTSFIWGKHHIFLEWINMKQPHSCREQSLRCFRKHLHFTVPSTWAFAHQHTQAQSGKKEREPAPARTLGFTSKPFPIRSSPFLGHLAWMTWVPHLSGSSTSNLNLKYSEQS